MIQLINFIDLTLEEKKMILLWRNDTSIKKWMYNSDYIILDTHLQYIESLKKRDDRIYFLVKNDNDYIGVIDFTSIDYKKKETEIGLYSNPNIMGNGKILMNNIIDYGFNNLKLDRLCANLLINNIKAYNLYLKFDFKEYKKDKKLIYMELKNENR